MKRNNKKRLCVTINKGQLTSIFICELWKGKTKKAKNVRENGFPNVV